MLRKMNASDIPQMVEIHAASWSPDELSQKLGKGFLQLFYENIVETSFATTYVYEKNGQIIGYATAFHDYQAFNTSLQRRKFIRLGFVILSRLLTRNIGIAELNTMIGEGKKVERSRFPKYHWGSTALANAYKGTPEGREALTAVSGAVFEDFEQSGYPGCWGLCDARNIPMIKYLERFGFHLVESIPLSNKTVVLYEKTFEKNLH